MTHQCNDLLVFAKHDRLLLVKTVEAFQAVHECRICGNPLCTQVAFLLCYHQLLVESLIVVASYDQIYNEIFHRKLAEQSLSLIVCIIRLFSHQQSHFALSLEVWEVFWKNASQNTSCYQYEPVSI